MNKKLTSVKDIANTLTRAGERMGEKEENRRFREMKWDGMERGQEEKASALWVGSEEARLRCQHVPALAGDGCMAIRESYITLV